MPKDKQPQQPLDKPSNIASDQASQDFDELEQLVEELKTYRFSEKLNRQEKATLESLALRLVDAGISLDDDDEKEQIPTDRHTRKNLRLLAEPAFDYIAQESQGDQELETELQTGVIKSLARVGILPASVRVFEPLVPKSTKPDKKPAAADEYSLTVKPTDKAFLESLVTEVESAGKWSKATTEAAAIGFLDIYYPAKTQVKNNRGTHQEILNAIATTNTYSHAVATALSKLPEIQQTSSIEDIRSEIFNQLKLRAAPAKLQELVNYDDYTIGTVPEVREFNNAIKGTQYEILAHQALSSLDIDSYRHSSLEEDISQGYDLVLENNGKKYYLDVKAARSFSNAVAEKYHPSTIIGDTKDRGYLVRQTRHEDQKGQAIRVIVLDVETTGAIKVQRNRLQLTDTGNYHATILEAMALVDNTKN